MNERYFTAAQSAGWRRFKMGALSEGANERRAGDRRSTPAAATDAVQAEARNAGFRDGYRAGQAQAEAEAARMRAVATQFAQSCAALEQELAGQLLDLALDIARHMLRADVKARREALLPVVREAIACLPDQVQRPQLHLNPADVELVRARIGDELQMAGFAIIEDHRVEPGGCRIAAANCEVDATLPARWRRVLAALGRDLAWSDG
ncbi:MAG: FliH/SctL family protein [Betaproteobacteria bacterium]